MNISLTIICAIAVLLATATAFLGQDDVENGVIFPWQFIASCVIGFLITHGEYYLPTYVWMYGHLAGDGFAGKFLSACVAALAETFLACLPMLVYRARCCNPIRGEGIVGYITRGKGVAVHSMHCPNVQNLLYEPERKIDVEWARDDSTPTAYPVKLTVYCDDRFGMLKNITGVIGDAKSNIRNITAHTANSQASVEVVLDISDLKHLENIIVGLRKIPGVHEVQRLQKI